MSILKTKGGSFTFLGFEFRRIFFSNTGRWGPNVTPKLKKRTALVRELKAVFRRYRSQPIERVINLINPVLRGWVNYFAVGHSRLFNGYRVRREAKVAPAG